MDDMVLKAMAKWPNVPDCYGWLGLDARGEFWMRDEAVQARNSFQAGCSSADPHAKGSRVHHVALKAFMQRNYQPDERGCWYFQNGPQRVFVELELAPLSCRLDPCDPAHVVLHTGSSEAVRQIWSDEEGVVYAQVSNGLAVIHSMDTMEVAQRLEQGVWHVENCARAAMPKQFGYVISPQTGR